MQGATTWLSSGLPRGGVPVAFEIARGLNAPLEVFIVGKLGVPGREELAFGAILRPRHCRNIWLLSHHRRLRRRAG
jgi:predicted phosphoribosyltransferase